MIRSMGLSGKTKIFGVLILAWSSLGLADDAPRVKESTFTHDVAPILNAHCVVCHRSGQIGPMPLTSFEESRPWAKSIRKNVAGRAMPPWVAKPNGWGYKETNCLNEDQIAKIVAWVDAGCPQGNPADLPALPTFSEEWKLGKPDEIIRFQPYSIAPDAAIDNVFEIPAVSEVAEDHYVTAVEIRCEPAKIVHHVILYVVDDRKRVKAPINWLGAWGPGTPPMVFADGTGRLLKKGAKIVANIHLTPRGTGGQTQILAGLHYAPKGTKVAELENKWVMNTLFAIPPGAPNYEVVANWTLPCDADLYRIMPHMHYRGKDMTLSLHYPDGRSDVLLETEWNNDWQFTYTFPQPLRMPKGTRFEVRGHYDNSAANPVNPDPTRTVRWAIDVAQEMFVGMVDYVRLDGETGGAE